MRWEEAQNSGRDKIQVGAGCAEVFTGDADSGGFSHCSSGGKEKV